MHEMDIFPSVESALNDRYRGHVGRDWEVWREEHYFGDANDIPRGATKAWIGRQKHNHRGVGTRRELRHLIAANVNQPFLEEIGELQELERLELEWPMVAKDLTPLLGLKKLAFLSIDSPRNIAEFGALLDLPALRTLIITNARKMTDLTWLGDAHQLEVLGIEGGMFDPCKIPSLAPLAGLGSLKALLGVSTKVDDRSLSPLIECPRLEFLKIACVAPRAAFEELKAAKPRLVCDWFRPEMWAALR